MAWPWHGMVGLIKRQAVVYYALLLFFFLVFAYFKSRFTASRSDFFLDS